MQAANKNKTAWKFVGGLAAVAVVTCAAGTYHQRAQRDATVDWHQVSTALLEVENAKRELHQSLQQRITKEQANR